MVSLHTICQDVTAQQITLLPYDMDGLSDAASLCVGRKYGIFIDPKQCKTMRQLKTVLSHEVGHCSTGALHSANSPYDLIARHEYKADRWAIERYIPAQEISQAMRAGYTEPWQLADYFDLSEEYIKKALHYWTECRGVDFNSL